MSQTGEAILPETRAGVAMFRIGSSCTPRPRAALVFALLLVAGTAACRGDSGVPGPTSDARRYTVRAEIAGISAAAGSTTLSLRHEAIPDFSDQSGKVVGMSSMVMPFAVAPGIRLDDVRAGDKVEARIAVGWSPPTMRVEQLRKLPADTALSFGAPDR
jgi:Cu/Ag efflux protein CusF